MDVFNKVLAVSLFSLFISACSGDMNGGSGAADQPADTEQVTTTTETTDQAMPKEEDQAVEQDTTMTEQETTTETEQSTKSE